MRGRRRRAVAGRAEPGEAMRRDEKVREGRRGRREARWRAMESEPWRWRRVRERRAEESAMVDRRRERVRESGVMKEEWSMERVDRGRRRKMEWKEEEMMWRIRRGGMEVATMMLEVVRRGDGRLSGGGGGRRWTRGGWGGGKGERERRARAVALRFELE